MTTTDTNEMDGTQVLDRMVLTPLQTKRLKEVMRIVDKRATSKSRSSMITSDLYHHDMVFSDGVPCKFKIFFDEASDKRQSSELVTRNVEANSSERDSQNVLKLFKAACLLVPGFLAASNRKPNKATQTRYELKKPSSPIPFTGDEPPLRFRGKSMLGVTELKLTELVHSLGLGVPGSGKTHSYILPMIKAFLDYQLNGQQPSMAVIDPKAELLKPIVEELERLEQSERLVVIGECAPFSYFRPEDGLHTKDRYYAVSDLVPGRSAPGPDIRWVIFADDLNIEFLNDDQDFLNASGLKLLESLLSVVELKDHMAVGQWAALSSIYDFGMRGMVNLRMLGDTFTLLMLCVGLDNANSPSQRYTSDTSMVEQWFYQARNARTVTAFAGSPEISHVVDFDTRQYAPDVQRNRLNIQALIDEGKVLVYQPAESQAHTVAGKALKVQFFRAIKERRDMERPSAYVCDEYHRFASLDDNGNLDITRAYRSVTIGATQSIEAMRLGLGGGSAADSALTAMLTNMPTKLVFRSTDQETFQKMKFFIPSHPQGYQHVLDVRPPSTLNVGESYFVIGKRWGRSQFQMLPVAQTV